MREASKTYVLKRRQGRADGATTDTGLFSAPACHSAISPPLTKTWDRPLRRRVRKSTEFSEFKDANYLQVRPQMQLNRPERKYSKRGKIQSMSHKSMMTLKRRCAQVQKIHKAYTFCLSYGENYPDAAGCTKDKTKLQRWICNNFPEFGMFWKREPQKRGATHFHVLAFLGEDEERAKEIGLKILVKWCDIANDRYGADQYVKCLKVHTHRTNFELMRGKNFFNYLAKYLAKGDDAMPDGYDLEGGGRWWGYFNKNSIPWAEEMVSNWDEFSRKETKAMERVVYKIRQSRANTAADRATFELGKRFKIHSMNAHMQMALHVAPQRCLKDIKLSPKASRKLMRQFLDPERKWRKAKKLRREGSVTILGNIDHITDSLDRFMYKTADHQARSRIFGDSWTPPLSAFPKKERPEDEEARNQV